MANKKPKNQITPDSRKDMKPRGRGKRALILEAIKEASLMEATPESSNDDVEKLFFKHIAIQASNPGSDHFGMCLKILADKGWSSVKPSMDHVEFEFDESASPSAQAAQVMKAASKGDIAPDVAKMFIDSISSMLKIAEVTELQDRINALEAAMNG